MASELIAPPVAGSITDLSTRFDALASRIRRLALLRGLGRLVFVGAILCGLGLLADWLWILPETVRLGWLAVTVLALSYTLWTAVIQPVFRKFTAAELAAIVESEYPELGERLTSAVELTNPNIPEDHKGSALMREYLQAETLRSTQPLDFRKAVPADQARKWGWTGTIAAAVLLIPFLLLSSGYGQMWARFFTPWGSHELPAELYFQVPQGDRVVARGEELTLLALPPDDVDPEDLPEAVDLVWTTPTGETDRRPMEYVADRNGYLITLPHVFEGFEYIITAKRKRSNRHTISVVDRPEITAFTLKITPPSYTGYPVRTVDGAIGDVEAFERSQVEATLEFNKPLAKAEWIWEAAEAVGEKSEGPIALPFKLSAEGKSAKLELLAASGWFAARVQDEHGLTNTEEPARNLTILADQPPQLNLSGQVGTPRARQEDVITLSAQARDDFGISALELHIETPQEETLVQAVPEEELGPSDVAHVFKLDLAELELADGDWIKYRVRTADNRPLPFPQEVWSKERRVIIDPNAELPGTQEVKERQNTLREILNAIRKDVQETQKSIEKLREDAEEQFANGKGKPFDRQELLTQLEQKPTELSERLEELAKRFGEHRLYANLTPETQRIAREPLKKAAEELRKAQTQTELDDKTETLKTSADALAKADRDLEKLAGRFDELAALEQDLLVVPRLAQHADRVAKQALDLAKRRDNPPAEETLEQKAARAGELDREEAALAKERQQLADALDDLLDHRPEVLAAARKSALEQIAELSKQAADLADRQDALTGALKTDAQETAEAAAPIAKHHEELLKKAEKLAPSPNKTEPKADDPPQVPPLDPDELRKILEELKAGNLDAAAEKQKALADRLDALVEELKKNQQLPADSQKAAQQLAKQQTQAAEAAKTDSQNAQKKQALPPSEARQKQRDELAKLTENTKRLQAGKEAEPQKQEALEALQKAAEAQEKLEELIKKKEEKPPADQPDAKPAPPKPDEELQRLMQENAEAQKNAADALDKLQQELAKKENQEKLHNEMNEAQERAEKLAQEARAVQEEIEQLKKEQAAPDEEQVAQAKQPTQPKPEQPNPPAQAKPPGAPQPNDSQPKNQDPKNSDPKNSDPNNPPANAQDPKPSRPNDETGNPSAPNNQQTKPAEPNHSGPNASRPEQSPAPPQKSNPHEPRPMNPQNTPGTEPKPAPPEKGTAPNPEETSKQNGQPANPQRAEDSSSKKPAAGQSLTERQAEMARKSAELALEVARDQGAESPASRQAANAARKANQAKEQTRDGVLDQAAKTAQESADAAKAASDELAKNPADPNQGEAQKLAQEAKDQAEAQSAIADELAEAAADPARRKAAQQAGQQELAEATEQLTKELEQAARELTSQPLDLEQPGHKTKAAGEATGQATEEMKQARTNAARGDSANAARSSEDAANALRQAAGESPAPPEDTPENTLVPGDLAEKVTDARRQLEEARQFLRDDLKTENSTQTASADDPDNADPQSKSQTDGMEPGDDPGDNPGDNSEPSETPKNPQEKANPPSEGQKQSGQGESGKQQPGQKQSGQKSALAQSAQKLQQAAQSLSQAAQELGAGVPGESGPRGQSQNQSQNRGTVPGGSSEGETGSQSFIPIEELEAELRRQTREEWGQLPGQLRTEILQGNKQQPGGDYARLIKLYSEELLKKQQQDK